MPERLIVGGGVAAGMSAAAKARRTNQDLEIVVYEQSGYVSYGSCGFPYYIKGEIPRIEDVIVRAPAQRGTTSQASGRPRTRARTTCPAISPSMLSSSSSAPHTRCLAARLWGTKE